MPEYLPYKNIKPTQLQRISSVVFLLGQENVIENLYNKVLILTCKFKNMYMNILKNLIKVKRHVNI